MGGALAGEAVPLLNEGIEENDMLDIVLLLFRVYGIP